MTELSEGMRPIPPDTRAGFALVAWADMAPEEEPRFNEWYNREHMRDRVLRFPSVLRGRRYGAVEGGPKYLAIYDAADAGVFSHPDYVSLVTAPDPLSHHFIMRFKNAHRTISRIAFAFGEGEGAALALWALPPEGEGPDGAALRAVAEKALGAAGVVGARLLVHDEDATAASTRDHVRQGNKVLHRTLILEAMDLDHLHAAASRLDVTVGAAHHVSFRLLYRVSK
ncbi:hypothetical protein ABLE91_10665 [Aquabacter sp. CN5-332]|uniref:hypothetical protein n=1 Tax=Aquabacter sp. CN5-332 TaxID=3156608 RepID=UPI0032B4B8BB